MKGFPTIDCFRNGDGILPDLRGGKPGGRDHVPRLRRRARPATDRRVRCSAIARTAGRRRRRRRGRCGDSGIDGGGLRAPQRSAPGGGERGIPGTRRRPPRRRPRGNGPAAGGPRSAGGAVAGPAGLPGGPRRPEADRPRPRERRTLRRARVPVRAAPRLGPVVAVARPVVEWCSPGAERRSGRIRPRRRARGRGRSSVRVVASDDARGGRRRRLLSTDREGGRAVGADSVGDRVPAATARAVRRLRRAGRRRHVRAKGAGVPARGGDDVDRKGRTASPRDDVRRGRRRKHDGRSRKRNLAVRHAGHEGGSSGVWSEGAGGDGSTG